MDRLLYGIGVQLEWHAVVLSFLVTFLGAGVVAAVYRHTYQGLSWSRVLNPT